EMKPINSLSRRKFAQLLGAGATYAVAQSGVSWRTPLRAADARRHFTSMPAGVVRLSANENPYGPSPMDLKAMTDAFSISCRYPDEHADVLIVALAKLNGVDRNQILLGNGSGEILKLCAAAFTGSLEAGNNRPVELLPRSRGGALPSFMPGRGNVIVADPTCEVILNYARVNRAGVGNVPLTGSFSHDLPKMLAGANQGLIYICN